MPASLWELSRFASASPQPARAQTELLNVSYDPTRELYREINAAFIAEWNAKKTPRRSARSASRMAAPSTSSTSRRASLWRRQAAAPAALLPRKRFGAMQRRLIYSILCVIQNIHILHAN